MSFFIVYFQYIVAFPKFLTWQSKIPERTSISCGAVLPGMCVVDTCIPAFSLTDCLTHIP